MRYADLEIRAYESFAIVQIRVGALRISLTFSHDQAIALCRAVLGGEPRECHARVNVGPLSLPKTLREIDEHTLNARVVETTDHG
jgi:hypothetical protein